MIFHTKPGNAARTHPVACEYSAERVRALPRQSVPSPTPCPSDDDDGESLLYVFNFCAPGARSALQIVYEVVNTNHEELHSYTGAIALDALGIEGARALEFIRVWSREPIEDSRVTAVQLLKFIGVAPAVEIPILVDMIKSESNEWDMRKMLDRIRELPAEATDAVLDALDAIIVPSNAVEEVISFLGLTPKPKSIAALESFLNSDNDVWRLRAAKCLMRMHADKHARALSELHMLKVSSSDETIAAEAALVLESVN